MAIKARLLKALSIRRPEWSKHKNIYVKGITVLINMLKFKRTGGNKSFKLWWLGFSLLLSSTCFINLVNPIANSMFLTLDHSGRLTKTCTNIPSPKSTTCMTPSQALRWRTSLKTTFSIFILWRIYLQNVLKLRWKSVNSVWSSKGSALSYHMNLQNQ